MEKLFKVEERRKTVKQYLCRNASWVGYILRINCFLHDAIEGPLPSKKSLGAYRFTYLNFKILRKILKRRKNLLMY